jgi:glycosyltransferase involved in cell wall biosynthesis
MATMILPKVFPTTEGRACWPWATATSLKAECISGAGPEPRITVVTPSFNQGKFIEETIRSVLLQDYPNLEYIIMDGGSTDNTVEIIKKYEPWITYWVSEKDRGQCHAINKGFARATGDIFAWLCSDDVYAPGALRCVAENLGNKSLAMVVGASMITHGPDTLEGTLDRRRPSFEEMAYDVKTLPQPSTFWTRDLWGVGGPLNEDLYFVMDYDLWLRMVPRAHSVRFIDDILSYQRTQPEQKSRNDHPRIIEFPKRRVEVGYHAARLRGESGLRWVARVWLLKLRKSSYRFWRLAGPGFHWQALCEVLKRTHS